MLICSVWVLLCCFSLIFCDGNASASVASNFTSNTKCSFKQMFDLFVYSSQEEFDTFFSQFLLSTYIEIQLMKLNEYKNIFHKKYSKIGCYFLLVILERNISLCHEIIFSKQCLRRFLFKFLLVQ